MNKIPFGVIDMDVKIIEIDGADTKEYDSIMFAGHVGYEVLEDDCTLKPQIGWGIALKSSDNEIEKHHEDSEEETSSKDSEHNCFYDSDSSSADSIELKT